MAQKIYKNHYHDSLFRHRIIQFTINLVKFQDDTTLNGIPNNFWLRNLSNQTYHEHTVYITKTSTNSNEPKKIRENSASRSSKEIIENTHKIKQPPDFTWLPPCWWQGHTPTGLFKLSGELTPSRHVPNSDAAICKDKAQRK